MNYKNLVFLTMPSFVAYITNQNWELLMIWFVFVCLDLLTGLISSFKNKNFKSSIMRDGLLKKCGEFIVLVTIIFTQRLVNISGFNTQIISTVFATSLCFKEIGSIVENWIKMGVNVPDFVTKWFKITNDMLVKDNIIKKESESGKNDKS